MTDTSTAEALDLTPILARAEAATPGPWGVANDTHVVRGLEVTGPGSYTCIQSVADMTDWDDRSDWGHDGYVEVDPEDDAEFIAHARTDVEAMATEILRQRDVIKRLIDFRNAKVAEANELAARLRTVRALAEGPHGEGDFGSVPASDLLAAIGEPHPAETRPAVVLDSTDRGYLIWSNHHKAWFAPKGCGYAANLADAGMFTLADTKQWLGRGCNCCPVPEVVVAASAVNQLDSAATAKVIAEATQAVIDAGQANKHCTKAEVSA